MFYRPERSEWIALARGPWHRRLGRSRAARATVATLCLLVLATNVFLVTQRGRTTPVSLDDALAAFRATNGTVASTSALVDDGSAVPVGEQAASVTNSAITNVDNASGTSVAAATVGAPAGDRPVAASAEAGGVVATGPAAFAKPAPGVYSYEVTGGEKISILGASHAYPSRVFATVEHGQGCFWRHTTQIAEEHQEHRNWCSQPGQLASLEDSGTVEFFGQKDTVSYQCGSGAVVVRVGDAPGTIHEWTCTSPDGGMNRYRVTQVGQVPLNIGTTTVIAERFHSEATMSGKSTGSAVWEWWVDAITGLPLRIEREVHTFAKSSFGDVQYDESATLQLVSLQPQT